MKISGSEVMFVVACILIALGLYFLYFVYRMYTGFRRLATEDKVKKVGGKHFQSNHSVVPVLPDKNENNKPDLNSATKYGNLNQEFFWNKYARNYCLNDEECKNIVGKDFSCGYHISEDSDEEYMYKKEGFKITNNRVIDGICRRTDRNSVY